MDNDNYIKKITKKEYMRWRTETAKDALMQAQLKSICDNEEEILDAFCRDISFGTSGMRGIMGPGRNRINKYVIRRATQGLANYLNGKKAKASVVVAYDSRKHSDVYAMETAKVLSGNGIQVHLFSEITPVPVLSYSIGELKCDMGIMITASHNSRIYNGYKVYNSRGYQIVGEEPDAILEEISKLDFFADIHMGCSEIYDVDKSIGEMFIKTVTQFSLMSEWKRTRNDGDFKVIYTPLNGTGINYVPNLLSNIGIPYEVVPSQANPDPDFTTCTVPNPEKIGAYQEGFHFLGKENGDILIATDPDCDRVGAAVFHNDMKVLLTGNQLGILIFDYLCHFRKNIENKIVIKSIVSSPLIDRIAAKYGLRVKNTLTGFKYIGEMITDLIDQNDASSYFYAFEESNGYLISPFICDKDGTSGAMIVAEVACWLKSQKKDMIDRLWEIYDEYGLCLDKTKNYVFEGTNGRRKMMRIMDYFRYKIDNTVGGETITQKTDYLQENGLPRSNVLSYTLSSGTIFIIRPSGTEPKVKVYFFTTGESKNVEDAIDEIIENVGIL